MVNYDYRKLKSKTKEQSTTYHSKAAKEVGRNKENIIEI